MLKAVLKLVLIASVLHFDSTCLAKEGNLAFTADFTYGLMGPKRPSEFVPGEMASVTGKVSGLFVDAGNKASYLIQWELLDIELRKVEAGNFGEGKSLFSLGGNSTRVSFQLGISSSLEPNPYTLRLTVEDLNTHKKAQIDLSFTLKPIDGIALSDMEWSRDRQGSVDAGAFFNEGEKAIIRYSIQGLEKENGQWKIASKLHVLDQNRKPVVKEEPSLPIKATAPVYGKLTLWGEFYAHRAGKYFLVLEVVDEISKKSSVHEIPFFVVSPESQH